jgi:hypothetical protein
VASQIPLQRQREPADGFGDYPVVSLAEACGKRDDAKRTLAAGLDPAMLHDMTRHTQLVAAQSALETRSQ